MKLLLENWREYLNEEIGGNPIDVVEPSTNPKQRSKGEKELKKSQWRKKTDKEDFRNWRSAIDRDLMIVRGAAKEDYEATKDWRRAPGALGLSPEGATEDKFIKKAVEDYLAGDNTYLQTGPGHKPWKKSASYWNTFKSYDPTRERARRNYDRMIARDKAKKARGGLSFTDQEGGLSMAQNRDGQLSMTEQWRKYIKEGEAEHFPWLQGIQATDDLEEIQAIVESDRFKRVGTGSFRRVYQPISDPGYVIKVINEYDDYKMRMNEDDFDTARRYPFIFPKAYVHSDDFSWIVMENTPPLVDMEVMQKVLDQSFPAEQEALRNAMPLPFARLGGAEWNVADPFHIMKMIMASFRMDRETNEAAVYDDKASAQSLQDIIVPVAGHAYQELSKVMHAFEIDKYEIGIGNIGHDENYNFKIIDSSVFSSDPGQGVWE
ncbi:MAG TPA: hypothetical protein EYN67_05765 [Flavobacteriales bacterium]|nr:hypothetical protein [Flavobacteriales bacterium]